MLPHIRKILIFFLAVMFVAIAASAENHVRIVRLSYINGDVQVDRGDGSGFQQALPNMPIVEGLKVVTGADGVAELEFEDGSTFRITPETEVQVRQLALEDSGATLSSVSLAHGTAYIDFRRHKDDVFELVIPQHQIALQHDVRVRVEVAQDEADLAVFSGQLEVAQPDRVVRVKKNETLDFSDAEQFTVAHEIETAPYDDWSREREKYREKYASAIDSGSSTVNYGLADLAYYGSSFDLPGYGWVWQPYGIGFGWNPFSSGYWNYYPATGWIWCSYAPWGWYPYRYGSWYFAPGYGWVWSPGRTTIITVNNWYPVAPVRSGPPGYRPPRPPGPPSGPGQTIVSVGNPPVHGPGRHPYDASDPVLAVDRDGDQGAHRGHKPGSGNVSVTSGSTAAGGATTSNGTTTSAGTRTAGGVSTFAPGEPAGHHRNITGDTPQSVRELRQQIKTPENQANLNVMTHQDVYDRHLHDQMERQAPPPAFSGNVDVNAGGSRSFHHEQPSGTVGARSPEAGSAPSWHGGGSSHSGGGSSAPPPAPMHTGGGGAAPAPAPAPMHTGGGGAAPAPSGGGAHGGRPPR